MREVERQVMLRIIDQKWREHLYEMDYLQEGINLRAMGQRDPLNEWQREGFSMFEQMMHGISQDFVKYVMHVQVNVVQQGAEQPQQPPAVQNVNYSAADDPVQRPSAPPLAQPQQEGPPQPEQQEPEQNVPVVRSDWEKTPRNAPCPCGSGKKFKLCHGR
jgi:preprotein translocase subunit SecA